MNRRHAIYRWPGSRLAAAMPFRPPPPAVAAGPVSLIARPLSGGNYIFVDDFGVWPAPPRPGQWEIALERRVDAGPDLLGTARRTSAVPR